MKKKIESLIKEIKMILIIREFKSYPGSLNTEKEYKVFKDDDITSVQRYLDSHKSDFEFKKL